MASDDNAQKKPEPKEPQKPKAPPSRYIKENNDKRKKKNG